MKIKTTELTGAALDWAVAKAAETELYTDGGGVPRYGNLALRWAPSTNWTQCGPLIEKYVSALNQSEYGAWWAHSGNHVGEALTPLIAACRAIVAAELGPEVEIPEELV